MAAPPFPPQSPPGSPSFSPPAFRLAPRIPTLGSRIGLPVVDEGPGYVRFRPFNDARVILLLRGQPPRDGIPAGMTPFWSLVATAPVGPFVVEVLRHKQVLSPPPWQPGMPPVDPRDYEPVDDVLLLPDGELRIPRAPHGFSDGEIGMIVQSIQVFSTRPGGAPDPSHRDYLPQGASPIDPRGAAPAPPPGAPGGMTPLPGMMPPGRPAIVAPSLASSPNEPAARVQGHDVTLQAQTFNMPGLCAACGATKETTLKTQRTQSRAGRGKVTRSFAVPYCNACAARVKATHSKGVRLGFATLGLAMLTGALSFAVPGLPAVILVALPVVVSVGFALVVMTKLAPRSPPPPAVGVDAAVRLISFKGDRSVLHCANPTWAQAFAQANGVAPVPKNRSWRFGSGSFWTAVLVAPTAALITWFTAHPEVHVDNPGPEALQVWLDGDPILLVPSNPNGVAPPSTHVAYGSHMLGYSKTGAAHAESADEVHVTMRDDFLYNPGKTGCYWVVADLYGSASVKGVAQGPQALQEFYAFDKVDTWFGDNPQTVSLSRGQSGDTRVAVQRAKACMELAVDGCDDAERDAFVHCEQAAKDDAALEQCGRAVTCGSKGGGSGKGESPSEPPEPSSSAPTPAPPHTAHATPEPRPVPPRPVHPPMPHPAAPAASGSAKHA